MALQNPFDRPLATEAEAEAGLTDLKAMSPLKTAAAIAGLTGDDSAAAVAVSLGNHEAATTTVHGISDTASLNEIANISPSTGDLISDSGGWVATTPSAAPGVVADVILKTGAGGKLEIAQLGVGIDPDVPLHVLGDSGEIRVQSSATASTNKTGRVTAGHYDITENPVMLINLSSLSTTTLLTFGGGSSSANAPTQIDFNVAANNTTVMGTRAIRINSDGIAIGGVYPTSAAQVIVQTMANGKAGIQLQAYSSAQTGSMFAVLNNAGVERYGVNVEGIVDYAGTMGDGTADPTTDAPTDWVEIEIGGATRYIPAYT